MISAGSGWSLAGIWCFRQGPSWLLVGGKSINFCSEMVGMLQNFSVTVIGEFFDLHIREDCFQTLDGTFHVALLGAVPARSFDPLSRFNPFDLFIIEGGSCNGRIFQG